MRISNWQKKKKKIETIIKACKKLFTCEIFYKTSLTINVKLFQQKKTGGIALI